MRGLDREDKGISDAVNRLLKPPTLRSPLTSTAFNYRRRAVINDGVRKRLEQIYSLPDYNDLQPSARRVGQTKRARQPSLLQEAIAQPASTPAGTRQDDKEGSDEDTKTRRRACGGECAWRNELIIYTLLRDYAGEVP
ncbi:unnamed protein product [Peniophora sp. CBMAI 1063]|nr:unnamed protein product [Peniophora sp. CBMAI 1063]